MRHATGLVYALLCITICHNVVLSVPIVVKRQVDFSDLSEQEKSWDTQFQDENIPVESGDREKRKIPFEIKNAVLGLIFGFKKPVFGGAPSPPVSTTSGPTTTDDTPVFDRKRVSLVIPDELFGSSFQLVTNVSKIVGDVLMGTAQRTQKLLEAMRPFAGKILTFKGVNVQTPPGGTTNNIR